jgi:hypothetical protein
MKNFLRKCLLFLVVVVLLNIGYLLVLTWLSPGFKKVYQISDFKNRNYDMIVLGNSMALDAIDAEYLTKQGVSTYNFAVAGDHVSTSLMLLKTYLKNNKAPKTVMVGLSSAIGQSYLNKVAFKNPEVEFFYHPDLKSNITNPPLLNFQWLSVDLIKILISKDHRNAKLVLGQWQTQKVIADQSVYKMTQTRPIDYNNPYLSKIIELCESKGIRLLLVELPGSNSNRDNLPFVYEVDVLGKKAKVYNLNNFESSVGSSNPQKDWLAADHLTQNGARKITAYVFENMIK